MAYGYVFVEQAEIKLLILYILEQARAVAKKSTVTRQWLSDFVMGSKINISYFDLQACIPTLAEDEMIRLFVRDHKDTLQITKRGTETVGYFYTKLPNSVRETIDKRLIEDLRAYEERSAVRVNYWADNPHCFTSELKIFEHDDLMVQLCLSFPDVDQAQKLATKFREKPDFFYKKIIEMCSEALDEEVKGMPDQIEE